MAVLWLTTSFQQYLKRCYLEVGLRFTITRETQCSTTPGFYISFLISGEGCRFYMSEKKHQVFLWKVQYLKLTLSSLDGHLFKIPWDYQFMLWVVWVAIWAVPPGWETGFDINLSLPLKAFIHLTWFNILGALHLVVQKVCIVSNEKAVKQKSRLNRRTRFQCYLKI